MGRFYLKITLFILAIFFGMLLRSVKSQDNEFVLHPDKLDSLYYRAAISALLNSKFKMLSKQVDEIDRIIFTECHREAQTIVQKARCLIKLMDARDQKESRERSGLSLFSFQNEDNPLRVLLRAILDTNWKTFGAFLKGPDLNVKEEKKVVRRKRSLESVLKNDQIDSKEFNLLPKSIQNLRRIERYLRLADYCRNYVDKLNAENAKSLQRVNFPTQFRSNPPNRFSAFETFQDFLQDAPFERLSILSPRIMSLFPSSKSQSNSWSRMLSPTLFSFHKEGAFPLPNILKLVLTDQREIHAWLDLLLQMSGAAKTLSQMINTMRPEMIQVEQRLYPKIRELEELDNKWTEFESKQSSKQRDQMKNNGYTFLDSKQADFLFDNVPEYVHYTQKQKEHLLEMKIRELAKLDENKLRMMKKRQAPNERFRRLSPLPDSLLYPAEYFQNPYPTTQYPGFPYISQFTTTYIPPIIGFTAPSVEQSLTTLVPPTTTTTAEPTTVRSTIPGMTSPPTFTDYKKMLGLGDEVSESPDAEATGEPKLLVLHPWAVQHRIGGFVILEGVVISPNAITGELFSPELLTFHLLSPRAFVAAALSPMAIFARILSPTAFRAEVLSPEALSAYVLSPEAFLAEILTPKVFEVRISSPKAFTLQVLSPILASPRVQSGEYLGIIVLSPSILSPHIMSDGCLNVEVLSPHLLSGHEENEHEHGEENETHMGHHMHEHCCNKHRNLCCKQKLPKHDSNSHFNQFVHSAIAAKTKHRNSAKTVLPYALWANRPQMLTTTKLISAQQTLITRPVVTKVPVNRVLISKQQNNVNI